jgi:hypothetical protein
MATFLAILSSLPKILALIQFIAGMVRDAEQRGLGRKEAVAESLERAHLDLSIADAASIEASQSHAKDSTDGAFDQAFRRMTP